MLKLIISLVLMGTLTAALPLSVDETTLRVAFQTMTTQLDKDGNGRLTLAEILTLWRPSQPTFSDAQFATAFGALDIDGDGAVDEDEFVRAASRPAPAEIVLLSFDATDVEGDGHLQEGEALQLAGALNMGDAEHVRYAIEHADHDGDGTIDLAEFVDATEELRRGGS